MALARRRAGYLALLRSFLVFFGGFFADAAEAPGIRKSSSFFPPLTAALSQRGLRPRPAQVSVGFSGLRYFGATGPFGPPRPNLMGFPPRPPNPESLDSSDSSSRRRSVTFALMAASTSLLRSRSLSIDIVLRAMIV